MGKILTLPLRGPQRPPTVRKTRRRPVDRLSRPRALDIHREPLGLVRSLLVTMAAEVVVLAGSVLAIRSFLEPSGTDGGDAAAATAMFPPLESRESNPAADPGER